MFRNDHGQRRSSSLPPPRVQTFWTPSEGHKRQGYTFHVQVCKRTMPTPGHFPEHLHGLSPPNGWTIRTDEPMAGAIPMVLDKPQANKLDGIFASGGIRSQHVVQCHDEDVPLPTTHGIQTT